MKIKPQITNSLWFIVAAYLILVAPLALDFNFYYPDEVHYSDAAIEMMQNNDFLTPYQGSGELRFNKPIITYWIVLLGFRIFGISAFAARFFFFLAGAGVLLLVYQICKLIYDSKQTALIGTAIAASNVTFLMSSMRSIPDILLCLFISLSLLGFAGFIRFGNQTPKKYHWLLFVGLALAFEVKGIPAIMIGGYGLLFLLINPWNQIKLKKLIHWPSIITAIIIASYWFVVMFIFYRNEFFKSFYNDQVGERISINFRVVLDNLGLSLGLIAGLLMPWITFISKKQKVFNTENVPQKTFQFFTVIGTAIFVLLAGLVFKFYDRYLLPLVPLWSVMMAFLISENITKKQALIKFWGILSVILQATLLAFAITISITLKEDSIHYIWLFSGLVVTSLISYQLFKTRKMVWLAISVPLIAYNLTIVTHTISFPGEGQQITQILKNNRIDKANEIGFVGNPQIASKLRIASKGNYKVINLNKLYAEYESENYNTLIVSERDMYLYPDSIFSVIGNSVSWSSPNSRLFINSLWNGKYRENLRRYGKKYYIISNKTDT